MFVDGDKPFTHGNCELTFTARVGKPKVTSDKPKSPVIDGQESLIVEVKIRNTSDTKRLVYVSFAGMDSMALDEFDNEYRATYRNLTELERIKAGLRSRIFPVGRKFVENVDPGESVTDVLCFDKPTPKATEVRVLLTGECLETTKPVLVRLALPKR